MRKYSTYWLHVHDKAVIRKNNNCKNKAILTFIIFYPEFYDVSSEYLFRKIDSTNKAKWSTVSRTHICHKLWIKVSFFLHMAMKKKCSYFCVKLTAIIKLCNGLRIYHLLITNLGCTFTSLIGLIIIKCFKP